MLNSKQMTRRRVLGLQAGIKAVDLVTAVPADDYFVFLISDANLAAYGVSSAMVADALLSDPRVRSYVVFIANEVEVGCCPCVLVVLTDAHIFNMF
jgi:hypothetical protein